MIRSRTKKTAPAPALPKNSGSRRLPATLVKSHISNFGTLFAERVLRLQIGGKERVRY